jgi:cysteine-rich repeat protein
MNTFTLTGAVCKCSSGSYADSVNKVCAACSGAISNCATCSSSTQCTTCASGYKLNTTTYQCQVQTCQVANCHACSAGNTSICTTCETGYSLNNSDTQCITKCGDKQLDSATEVCDDGNIISGDGCSSTCQLESGFTCSSQIVNLTMTFSQCYFSASITFSLIWIRKIEGTNTLKFEFELGQRIKQWSTVNFTNILAIDNVDSTTNLSTGLGS